MKTYKINVLAIAMVLVGCAGKEDKTGAEAPVRYSQEMIEEHLHGWYNKDVLVAFPYADGAEAVPDGAVEASWDYVPGVVAKGILDCWEYYQDSVWADEWYKSLCEWGLRQQATDRGGILDDLNCAKVFLELYEGAKPGGKFENEENAAYFMEQMQRAARGLEEHKNRYSIQLRDESSGFGEDEPEVNGGWMHKATDDPTRSYRGQMWCDGAYMGPALLAQLLAAGACEGIGLGWNDVYDQFYASWPYLWDEEKKLLYHVLFTDVEVNKNAKAIYEAGHLYKCTKEQCTMYEEPFTIYHSEEFWGRAAGWYILALVDVLEAYLINVQGDEGQGTKELPSAQHFDALREYLQMLADGLVARQDPKTGCWYQLLQYGPEKCVTQGVDATGSDKYTNVGEGGTQCNYLESSASCLITAALLKGSRLGLIDHMEAGKRGFEGIQRTFVREVPSTKDKGARLTITGSCQSAGLGKDRWGNAAYYLIGKDVPIQDNTEGKVLGAYLMAAVEYERAVSLHSNL